MDTKTKAVNPAAQVEGPCCGNSEGKVRPARTPAESIAEQQPKEPTGAPKGKSNGCCCGGG